ncbi:MAG: hypothetical protein CMB71_04500 [Euryarchaeota archaeon]|nr:hypothetical protein [Euryarchaeota archaeon]
MPKKTIRSRYQRRILDWLLDGGGTVSQASDVLGIAMPHASLAMRQLRELGEVQRDDGASIRGAMHRLTPKGADHLLNDLIERVRKVTTSIPTGKDAVVLSNDRTSVVLGVLTPPRSRLVSLPRRTDLFENEAGKNSSGNTGGLWAVQRGPDVHWVSLSTFEASSPPNEPIQGTLTAYANQTESIGILRLRLLGQTDTWGVANGTWIQLNSDQQHGPSQLHVGEHAIGDVAGTTFSVRPEHGLYAHLTSSVDRTLLVSSLGNHAQIMTESLAFSTHRALPIEVLGPWMKKRHPRLSTTKRKTRLRALTRWLLSGRGKQPTLNLRRSLLADFGERTWTEQSNAIDVVLLDGISQHGATCIVEWMLESTSFDMVVEWPWAEIDDLPLMERLLASGRCRVLITSRGEAKEFSSKTATIQSTDQLATVSYRPQESYEFRVQLRRAMSRTEPEATREGLPANATELLEWFQSGGLDEDVLTGQADASQHIRQAMRMYPQGDSDFANAVEREAPLAAWVASPRSERGSRWKRIGDVIPQDWVDLIPVGELDAISLIKAMSRTGTGWRQEAVREITNAFDSNSSLLVDVVPLLDDDVHKAMASYVLLMLTRKHRHELQSILPRAATIWLDAPYDEEHVLNALFDTDSTSNEHEALLHHFLRGAGVHPKGSILRTWADLYTLLSERAPIPLDMMRTCINILPQRWWSAWALDWLDAQLSTAGGREWLAHHPKNWPALIFRPNGERLGLPGFPHQHVGYLERSNLKLNLLMVPNGGGSAALMDVHDMIQRLETNGPVHQGRIHRLVGWLTCDVETWPEFTMNELLDGDSEIAKLLIGRAMLQRIR